MRIAILGAVAAFGLIGAQAMGVPAIGHVLVAQAHADALDRYEGGATVQRHASPQRTAPFAAGEQAGFDRGRLS